MVSLTKSFTNQCLLSGVIRCLRLHELHLSYLPVGSVVFPQAFQVLLCETVVVPIMDVVASLVVVSITVGSASASSSMKASVA